MVANGFYRQCKVEPRKRTKRIFSKLNSHEKFREPYIGDQTKIDEMQFGFMQRAATNDVIFIER